MTSTALFLASLLSPFADGTSPVRVVFLALIAVVILGISWVTRLCIRGAWGRLYLWSYGIAATAIVLLSVSTLGIQITLFHTLAIPQDTNATFITNDEITNTRLIHTHVGKVVFGAFAPMLSETVVALGDTGAALVPYIPDGGIWLIPILLVLSMVSFGVLHAARYCQVPAGMRRSVWSFLYILLVFVLLQNLLDGGILAQNTLLAFLLLSALVWVPETQMIRAGVSAFAVCALVALSIEYAGLYGGSFSYERTIASAVVLLGTTGILYRYAYRRRVPLSITALCVAGVLAFAYYDSASIRSYAAAVPTSTETLISTYPQELSTLSGTYETLGSLRVYRIDTSSYQSIGAVLTHYRLPYWYRPVSSSAWPGCEEGGEVTYTFTLLSQDDLLPVPLNAARARVALTKLASSTAPWHRYAGTLTMDPCLPRPWNVLHEAVVSAGTDTAVIYGMRSWGY